MGCFSWDWLGQLLVGIVIIVGVVAIVQVLLPFIVRKIGDSTGLGGLVIRVLTIVLWVIIAIFAIWFCIDMIKCLVRSGLHLPRHG